MVKITYSKVAVALVSAMVTAAFSALALSLGPAKAAFPGSNGKLAFVSNRVTILNPQGDYEVFTMNPDGTGLKQLTINDDADLQPTWSADGEQIAYQSNRDGDYEVFTMNANGTEKTNRTQNAIVDTNPSFSPDETHIAFQRLNPPFDREVFTMNADGAN